jgi:hypothetical protein
VAIVAVAKVPATTNAVRGRFIMFPPIDFEWCQATLDIAWSGGGLPRRTFSRPW